MANEITNITVSGVTYDVKSKRDSSYNTVSTLTNLPVNKNTVIANLTGATTFSLASGMPVGSVINVLCNPTSNFNQEISGTGISTSFENKVIEAKTNIPFMLKIICYASGKYYIHTGSKTKLPALGDKLVADAAVGDYLLSDGSCMSASKYSQLSKFTVIGVCATNTLSDGKKRFIAASYPASWEDGSPDDYLYFEYGVIAPWSTKSTTNINIISDPYTDSNLNGEELTDNIINFDNNELIAAKQCRSFNNMYLPTVQELKYVCENVLKIQSSMNNIGMSSFSTAIGPDTWTSNVMNTEEAYTYYLDKSGEGYDSSHQLDATNPFIPTIALS